MGGSLRAGRPGGSGAVGAAAAGSADGRRKAASRRWAISARLASALCCGGADGGAGGGGAGGIGGGVAPIRRRASAGPWGARTASLAPAVSRTPPICGGSRRPQCARHDRFAPHLLAAGHQPFGAGLDARLSGNSRLGGALDGTRRRGEGPDGARVGRAGLQERNPSTGRARSAISRRRSPVPGVVPASRRAAPPSSGRRGALRRRMPDAAGATAVRASAPGDRSGSALAVSFSGQLCGSGNGAIRGGSSPPPNACGSCSRAWQWRARCSIRRRCRSDRRSSRDVRCCHAAPAPACGGHRRQRRRSPRGGASGHDWCWRPGDCPRIDEPARQQGRSAPARPRTRRKRSVPASLSPAKTASLQGSCLSKRFAGGEQSLQDRNHVLTPHGRNCRPVS